MRAISVENAGDEFVIRLKKNSVDETFVMELLGRLRMEQLAKEVDLNSGVDYLGEEIKKEWWLKNKSRLMEQ